MTDLVVGSGPSGVAVAAALLKKGREVHMVDGGKRLEPAALARRSALAATPQECWSASDLAAFKAPQYETPDDGRVRRFGSDFAMEPADTTFAETGGVALRSSLAVGGLSNLWGSAVLPYAARDISDWPVPDAALQPHYRAVAEFLPISGTVDGLAEVFPGGLSEGAGQIPPTAQATVLLARLADQSDRLAALGVRIGAARQAVSSDCTGCGLCLHGCPYGFIWSAATTLDSLVSRPGFRHSPGRIVRSVVEEGSEVVLTCADGTELRGDRVFLAAGVLETARILLSSTPMRGGTLGLQDSPHAFMPMLHRWRTPRRVDALPLTTLPQLFVEIDAPDVSPHVVHTQLYTWNDFYVREMRATHGRRLPGSAPLWAALSRRLVVAQTFLHSDHAARIELRCAGDGRLDALTRQDPQTGRVMDAAARRLARAMRPAGLHMLPVARRAGAPGSSFHVGGSLPMSRSPGPMQTDILGRPAGARRVHVVDASVLPTVPATTITFAVMANAHRIGTDAP